MQRFSPRSRHFAKRVGLAVLYFYFIRALAVCIFLPVPLDERIIAVSLSIVGIALLTKIILSVPQCTVPSEDLSDQRAAVQ